MGTFLIVHLKALVFPHPWNTFCVAKSSAFVDASNPTGFEDAVHFRVL